MPRKQMKKAETLEKAPAAPADAEKKGFEKPRIQKLGQLPRVTNAFGGSFTP